MRPYKLGTVWIDLDHILTITEPAQRSDPYSPVNADGTFKKLPGWYVQIQFAFLSGPKTFRLSDYEKDARDMHTLLLASWRNESGFRV